LLEFGLSVFDKRLFSLDELLSLLEEADT
jgi:hypothetical protein